MRTVADTPLAASSDNSGVVHERTRVELKRGAFLNAVAMVASNFRGIFNLLVARLFGPISLGLFSVAWSAADLMSKAGIVGLDDAVTTFIARAEATGDRARSRRLFRLALVLAVAQSIVVASLFTTLIRVVGNRTGFEPEMLSALAVILWVLPGLALYRISTSASRGMKVMQHDIYSRGITESLTTIVALLLISAIGFKHFAPEIAAIIGTFASGIVAWILASKLFRGTPNERVELPLQTEAGQLVQYALPIGADQFLNAFIWRLDVIMLAWFVGRVPGVTLTTLGIYCAVVGLANGLRRVSQPYAPILAPIVAGMTATGEHGLAAATYARLLQWMLWILLPFLAVMILAGKTILLIYGSAFQTGSAWLVIVATACAAQAFITLGETVIMVQRPGLNFTNSIMTCLIGGGAMFWLIQRFGVMGAAIGILFTYFVQGTIRTIILRFVFRWPNPWKTIRTPVLATIAAALPASLCRAIFHGIIGEVAAAVIFLSLFGLAWLYHSRSVKLAE